MDKIKVFGLYLGCEVMYGFEDRQRRGVLTGHHEIFGWQVCDHANPIVPYRFVKEDLLKLILTPLEQISDEDVVHLATLLIDDEKDMSIYSKAFDDYPLYIFKDSGSKTGFYYIDICKYDGNIEVGVIEPEHPSKRAQCDISACLFMEAYDYLRSRYYNLPYMGMDLVENGIAVLKTK